MGNPLLEVSSKVGVGGRKNGFVKVLLNSLLVGILRYGSKEKVVGHAGLVEMSDAGMPLRFTAIK